VGDEIKEIRLNKQYRLKVAMDDGLDAKCPVCSRITEHKLATPDSVKCAICGRIIRLVWVG